MGRWISWFLVHGFFFSVITALTQVGGIAYLLAMVIISMVRRRWHFALPSRVMSGVFWFTILYLMISSYVVPPLASAMGREPLQCAPTARKPYGARSYLYCLLGRNYVRAETREVVEALAAAMAAKDPQTRVVYLDASFPFLDLFPMPPHLSHNDGLNIDLAYFYGDRDGRYRALASPSPLGYWGFEAPTETERTECTERFRFFRSEEHTSELQSQ